MKFTDAVTVAGTRRTTDGYLIADAKAVRSGIQVYLGREVGKPELDRVRVFRSEAEVRSGDSLSSFSHAPVTVDHPSQPVTAENWKDLAVGEVSTSATWDGNRISLPLILKDAAAIATVAAGKRELSAGYTCDLDFTPGVTADGQQYDAQQKNIRANHVAIVERGRAGSECRIGDADPHAWGAAPITLTTDKETITMSDALRTVVVDGLSVQTTDQGAQAIEKLTKDRDADRKAHSEALAAKDAANAAAMSAKDKELAAKDAEIDKLKANQLDAAKLDQIAEERATVVADAKRIVSDFNPAGQSNAQVKRAIVVAKLGDGMKDKSDDYIEARFDGLVGDAKPVDGLTRSISAGPRTTVDHQPVATAHAAMVTGLQDAWKTPVKGAA